MNIQLGNKIRSLRLAKSMTQEQLAQALGVSAQAISKWESNANMPDIQMLPELAVIFGTSIDELFTMTDDSRMDRIENQLDSIRFLESGVFEQNEQFLKTCIENPRYEARATLLLAQLYNKRAEEYRDMAKPVARKALLLNPSAKEAHNAVFDAENGPFSDWNLNNFANLIDFYKDIVKKHPDDIRNYFWLLKLLIHDHRLEEARMYAEQMRQVDNTYHYEMYMGQICKEDCDLNSAMAWWKKMTEHSPEKWIVWAEYGDVLAKLGKYDEAVFYYKKAMPLRPRPRFIDCEDAVADICLIRKDLEGALQMKEQSLRITMEDWTAEGEVVHQIQREIQSLKDRINSQNQEVR